MSEGTFLRLNSAMLNSVEPLQMFSIVGTIESCDGTTLVVKSVDMGQVFFTIDPGFVIPGPGRVVEVMGIKTAEGMVSGFIARDVGPSEGFDMSLYNDLITQIIPKFPEPFQA
jgi:hypothetical protein